MEEIGHFGDQNQLLELLKISLSFLRDFTSWQALRSVQSDTLKENSYYAQNTVNGSGVKGTFSGPKQFLAIESHLKMMKFAFLFHLKNSFCSQDIYVSVLSFWLCIKTAW